MLVLMLILVNVFNISASPYYAHAKSILNATRDFLDKAIVVFPMAFVLMLGEIDISVASIMALSATIMGVAFDAGVPMIEAIGLALVKLVFRDVIFSDLIQTAFAFIDVVHSPL